MSTRVPKYRLHKASGQALVEHEGRRIYLGRHGSAESKQRYRRFIAELFSPASQQVTQPEPGQSLSIDELILRYFRHAKQYYNKNGKPTSELGGIRTALRRLRRLYGAQPAAEFSPKAFRQVRQGMIDEDLSRTYINQSMDRIRRMYRWAVAEELVPPSVIQALAAVPGLKRGRSEAKETPPVLPVDDAIVEATLRHLPPVLADMVRFQRLTGCRPTEVCTITPGRVDREPEVWLYRPESHKTEHHQRSRTVAIGPRAQAVLAPYLYRPANEFCFSPRESERRRLDQRHRERKTPSSCGDRPGTNRKRKPARTPGPRYTKDSYNRAINRACKAASVAIWSPNQLRHARATEVRHEFGLEAAQVALGHSNANVTQIYAERDLSKSMEVAKRLG